jgi:hypothetical protein
LGNMMKLTNFDKERNEHLVKAEELARCLWVWDCVCVLVCGVFLQHRFSCDRIDNKWEVQTRHQQTCDHFAMAQFVTMLWVHQQLTLRSFVRPPCQAVLVCALLSENRNETINNNELSFEIQTQLININEFSLEIKFENWTH